MWQTESGFCPSVHSRNLCRLGVSRSRLARIAVPLKVNTENKRSTLLARTILLWEVPPLLGE